jgi:hypothetical protein
VSTRVSALPRCCGRRRLAFETAQLFGGISSGFLQDCNERSTIGPVLVEEKAAFRLMMMTAGRQVAKTSVTEESAGFGRIRDELLLLSGQIWSCLMPEFC